MINPAWRAKLRNTACDVLAVWLGLRDPRVPRIAKGVALFSFLYLVMPFDLIPDAIPIFGWLDDLVAVPLSAFLATKLMPFPVLRDLRRQADARITLWGRRALPLAIAFVFVWLLLAATGGWLVWKYRSSRQAIPADTQSMFESYLSEMEAPSPGAP